MSRVKSSIKLPALSLAEVLVVLLLAAITLTIAAQFTVRVMISIKNDEIADTVTGRVLQALELAKSPTNIQITADSLPIVNLNGSYSFAIKNDQQVLWKRSNDITKITSCNSASPYIQNIVIDRESTQLPVCIQVIVRTQTGLSSRQYYQLEINTVYEVTGQTGNLISRSVTGYRRDPFSQI